MKLLITGGSLIVEIQDDPIPNILKQLAAISQKTGLDLESKVEGLDAKRELSKRPSIKDGTKFMGKLNWKPKLPI